MSYLADTLTTLTFTHIFLMSNRCESKCLSSIIDYPLIVSNKTYQLVTQSLPITYWWHSLPIYHTFNDLKPVHIATWNPGTLSFPLLLSRTKEKERSWVQGWSYCSCCCSCFLGYSKLAKGAISSHVLSILALSGSKAWVDFGLIETSPLLHVHATEVNIKTKSLPALLPHKSELADWTTVN